MKDIEKLKSKNIWEKIGFFVIKNPQKTIAIIASALALFMLIFSTPYFIQITNKHKAEICLNNTQEKINKLNEVVLNNDTILKQNKIIYKDYDKYLSELSDNKIEIDTIKAQYEDLRAHFERNNIKHILNEFYHNKKNQDKVIFSDRLSLVEEKCSLLNSQILEVKTLSTSLLLDYVTLTDYTKNISVEQDNRYIKLSEALTKAKNVRVKKKINSLFQNINENKKIYTDSHNQLSKYNDSVLGKYSLDELRAIKADYEKTFSLKDNANISLSNYDNYWDELHEQYYTKITRHYSERSTDYVTESNPAYQEWTETETYQDTETRYKTETSTERVYVGSRIVGDHQEDIYETRTVSKQVPYQETVTKTRTVQRNNGQPRTISVPYTVYSFYYTVEKHTPDGIIKSEKYVGKKHSKYDFSPQNWNYKDSEQVGYTEWKQLWNDNQGIVRGKNIKVYFE